MRRGIPAPSARAPTRDSTSSSTGKPTALNAASDNGGNKRRAIPEPGRRATMVKANPPQLGKPPDENIKVCVRIRPPNEREERHSGVPAWTWKDNTIAQTGNSGTRNRAPGGLFTYDHLFDPLSDTEEIYDNAVRRVILATMGGYHGSVFAYGQTSTGKTHTMQGTEEQPGVIPLAIEECFSYVAASEDDREFLFRVSYLEIYNEQINDLLCPASAMANVRILESKKLGVQLQGVKEEVVISPQQVYALISAGEAQRHVGSTDANKNSSRSHTIFRMVIESRSRTGRGRSVMSTLSLVDLAGSESVRLANTHGQRQIEGGFINKSLLTLGKVVSMLTEEGDKVGYIPYRDSKLTRLLQPSLGGNAQITIICTVTAALLSVDETVNTLKFANRAKRIKNHASINETSNEKTLLKKYLEEIAELKQELARAKASAEEAATMPPPMARLMSPNASPGSSANPAASPSSARAAGGGGGGDGTWGDEDDTEIQLQSAIAHLERLILKSRVGKSETPNSKNGGVGAAAAAAAAAAATATAAADGRAKNLNSSGGSAAAADGGSGGGGAGGEDGLQIKLPAESGRSIPSRLRPPLTDRASMLSRRQSTSFFDTKPLHSARESGSFTKAWNGIGGAGRGAAGGGLGALGEDHDWNRRRPATSKAAPLRRQSERWGWGAEQAVAASEEVLIGTPPTVEGSADSNSGSPSDGRPPPLETPLPERSLGRRSNSVAALNVGEGDSWVQHNRGGRGGSEGDGSTGAVDLEFELEHVHTELRNFLQKKRARKLGAGGEGGGPCKGIGPQQDEVEELRQQLHKVEIDTALSQADSNFLQRELESKEADIAECMDLLEEMERQQKALSDENSALRRENESWSVEVTRLSAILAAREQELHDLKGVSAFEETF